MVAIQQQPQHLLGPCPFPVTTTILSSVNTVALNDSNNMNFNNIMDDSISVLSWNILLPNSQDGWWTYKMYHPKTATISDTQQQQEEEVIQLEGQQEVLQGIDDYVHEYSKWEYRQNLIKERIRLVNPDIVCFQEVSPLSYMDDFRFMSSELGYTGNEMYKKGRFRPATFWKSTMEVLSTPVHKDRTLLTAFRKRRHHQCNDATTASSSINIPTVSISSGNDDTTSKINEYHSTVWYVLNCHLQAGKNGARRLRQINDGIKAVVTLARKLQSSGNNKCTKKQQPSTSSIEDAIALIVCGDFNGDNDCDAVRFMEDGSIDDTFIEDNEIISSNFKKFPLSKPLMDVAASVHRTTTTSANSKANHNSNKNQQEQSRKQNEEVEEEIKNDAPDQSSSSSLSLPPPPTLVVPELISLLVQKNNDNINSTAYVNPILSDDAMTRLKRIYYKLATKTMFAKRSSTDNTEDDNDKEAKVMSLVDVQRWLSAINGHVGRGSEFRSAAKIMIVENNSNNTNNDNNVHCTQGNDDDASEKVVHNNTNSNKDGEGEGDDDTEVTATLPKNENATLSLNGFKSIYQDELNQGKFWGIAYDMAILGEPLNVVDVFQARYDRMYCTPENVQIQYVMDFVSTTPCPNNMEPSDHLPIAVLFTTKNNKQHK